MCALWQDEMMIGECMALPAGILLYPGVGVIMRELR